jgi:hypothetical protein
MQKLMTTYYTGLLLSVILIACGRLTVPSNSLYHLLTDWEVFRLI